jgi:hypothetical protein
MDISTAVHYFKSWFSSRPSQIRLHLSADGLRLPGGWILDPVRVRRSHGHRSVPGDRGSLSAGRACDSISPTSQNVACLCPFKTPPEGCGDRFVGRDSKRSVRPLKKSSVRIAREIKSTLPPRLTLTRRSWMLGDRWSALSIPCLTLPLI